jgi:branched-chain amino acid transport system substrate-binding protein
MKKILLAGFVFIFVAAVGSAVAADAVKWGTLIDLSGPTSDWGKSSAQGQIDAAKWINDNGGINGKKLELIIIDDKYKIPDGVTGFKRLQESDQVAGVYIQSTGTTHALKDKINSPEAPMPTFGASFNATLQIPKEAPYNFFVGPSYGDQARIALKWIKDNWTDKSRNPKVVYIYPDNLYGREILNVVKDYAKKIGVDVGADQVVDWPTLSAQTQMQNMKKDNPDFAYITSTAHNAANIIKDAKRLGLKTKFICNIRASDEKLIKLAGAASEGVYIVQPFAVYGENVPMMKTVAESNKNPEFNTVVYVEGWVNMLTIAEALKRADKAGKITSAELKKVLETLKDFETGGLAPPITYSPEDHRASTKARIYEIKGGKFVPASEYIDIGREAEYFGK